MTEQESKGADASVLIYGMPNEDATEIFFMPDQIVLAGRSFLEWDRDAIIERILTASGNRGDVRATDASGILQEMALSAIGVASLQVGCTAGAVSIAAFKTTPEISSMPVAYTAAVSLIVDALLQSAAHEVEPVVIVKLECDASIVSVAAESFGLNVHACGTDCIAYTRKHPESFDALLTFDIVDNAQMLHLVASPCPVTETKVELPVYDDVVVVETKQPEQEVPKKYLSLRLAAVVFLAFVLFGMWAYCYPNHLSQHPELPPANKSFSSTRDDDWTFDDSYFDIGDDEYLEFFVKI